MKALIKQLEKQEQLEARYKRGTGQHTSNANFPGPGRSASSNDSTLNAANESTRGLQETSENIEVPWEEVIRAAASPLPSNDSVLDAVDERARRLRETSKNLEVPFTLLTEPFMLDDQEQRWSDRELKGSGLSENDYPEETWGKIVEAFGITNGLYKAAEVKCGQGDSTGALSSWLKWISIHRKLHSIEYVNKDEWLLLAKIYAGMRCSDGAQKALGWAKAARDAEEPIDGQDPSLDQYVKADWNRRFNDLLRETENLTT